MPMMAAAATAAAAATVPMGALVPAAALVLVASSLVAARRSTGGRALPMPGPVQTRGGVAASPRPAPPPLAPGREPCKACAGRGKRRCANCRGRGRTNLIDLPLLPSGVRPVYCRLCRGGLCACDKCFGSGVRPPQIGFRTE